MSLWIDKHRPVELGKLDYHQDQAHHLSMLVEGGDFPHLLVYGPPGAGKKVRRNLQNIMGFEWIEIKIGSGVKRDGIRGGIRRNATLRDMIERDGIASER